MTSKSPSPEAVRPGRAGRARLRGQAVLLVVIVLGLFPRARGDSVVVFNEIQYHPADEAGPEWIELHNQMAVHVDLSGWRLGGGVEFTFPAGTVIPAGGYLLVSSEAGAPAAEALGPWSGRLSNGGERLRLRNNSGRLMDEIEFGDRGRWPVGADGSGASLAKIREGTASGTSGNWRASAQVGGTPGRTNFPDPAAGSPEIPLLALDATWRYNQSGAALPDGWAASAHAAGSGGWMEGPALLGFEESPEILPAPLRTIFADPRENEVVTYYFETEFDLGAQQVEGVDRLLLRHVIDDGAVFYLNGVEAEERFNMDPGMVDSNTTSAGSVRNAELRGPLELPVAALLPGLNRLSVEVHQQTAQSSDIVFGASLDMTRRSGVTVPLVISEIAGTEDPSFAVELSNTGDRPVLAEGFVLASRGGTEASYTLPEGTTIEAGGFLALGEAELGFRPANDDRLFLFTPGRQDLLDAVRADDLPRAWSEEHGRMLVPAERSMGGPNRFALNREVVINEIMYHFREDPGTGPVDPVVASTVLVGSDAVWRYNESGEELAFDWAATPHAVNGVNWLSGPAPIGFELGTLPDPIRTMVASPIENSIVTYYFETEFVLTPEQLAGSLRIELRHLIDDGAVFYVNGMEVARHNLPAGVVTASTLAESSIRDAVYQGPLVLPVENLVPGANRLSVEVHQDRPGNSDVVFGLRLDAVVELEPARAARPIVERDEEWVELFNRGSDEVELTGWSIDGGIDFEFPSGTRIPPGGYLVVCNDVLTLTGKYPLLAERIIGGFRNRLNNGSELVRLVDEVGNPVDEVHYFEAGRWPAEADGNGGSLELRDPHADNANPAAWAASDDSGAAEWQTIRYRGHGGQSFGLTNWNEFRLGMLRAGEVLIDDVSVVRDPDGAAEELIQNGTFATGSAHWRILGNHRHSLVRAEPGNPGNQVLQLVATGATDTRHNHLETTFVNNTPLDPNQEYEVSFRARWVKGSNQVHSSCYYQRLARTTQLARPEQCGTPGRANSMRVANLGPTFSDLRHEPPVPAALEPVVISAEVADPDGLGPLTLRARYNEGPVRSFPIVVDGAGQARGSLPGAAEGAVIQFWIEAEDALGAASYAPAGGPDSRALIQVADGQGTALPQQEMRLIMLPSDLTFLLDTYNLMSNERLGGTSVYNGDEITYDVGIRLRGSGAGRARDGTVHRSFSVAFPADQPFRGVHQTVAIDRSGRVPVQRRQDEIYLKHMFNHAGVPCMYDDLVYLVGPSPTYSGTAILQMASYGSVFTSSQFDGGTEGSVFNVDITYDPVTTSGGVEDLKPPSPFVHLGTDFQDRGDSKEDYRTSFQIRTGRRRDDYATLLEFCKTLSLPAAELEARVEEVMDVDEWMRYSALVVLSGVGDTWVQGGLRHNLRLYGPPAGRGRVVVLPWDGDILFSGATNATMLPMTGNFRRVVDLPRVRRLYWGHVYDLVNRTFNESYMEDWLDHYGAVMGADLSSQLSFIRARGAYALTQLPAEVPFRITTQGGGDFSVEASEAILEGRGWINVRELRLAGRAEALPTEWLDGERWRVRIPLVPGPNSVSLEAYDFAGILVDAAALTITSTVTVPQPVEFLRITEVHYHPLGDDAMEFVELKNIGASPLQVGGVHFADGIDFTIPAGTTLEPGGFGLVVRDRAAFEAHYGHGLPILGQFSGAFDNEGERIELRDAVGNVIHDFIYSDQWNPLTDGGGLSLVIRNPAGAPSEWGLASAWTASRLVGGSPGRDEVDHPGPFSQWQALHFTESQLTEPEVSGPLGDADGDGVPNLFSYLKWTDPRIALGEEALPVLEMVDGRMRLLVRRQVGLADLTVEAEFGDDLVSWSRVMVPTGPPRDHGDGTETIIFEDPLPAHPARFGRVRLTLSPP